MERSAIDLLNSYWRDYRGSGARADRLDNPEWVKSFLVRWELAVVERPTRAQIESLRELRGVLWRIVKAVADGARPAAADLSALNEALGATPLRRSLVREGDELRLEVRATKRDWNWVLGEIAASLASVLAENDPSRIRLCENDDCRWVFYDESKSRSRRWCADVCGNLIKVRKFRERAKRAERR